MKTHIPRAQRAAEGSGYRGAKFRVIEKRSAAILPRYRFRDVVKMILLFLLLSVDCEGRREGD